MSSRYDWLRLPRWGKRKRQVLIVLNKEYEEAKAAADDTLGWIEEDEDYELFADSLDEQSWGLMSREEILREAASAETGKDLRARGGALTGLILEIAPEALREEYLARHAAIDSARTPRLQPTEVMVAMRELHVFVRGRVRPLRLTPRFKKRWGALRSSTYAAIRALEAQGFIERRSDEKKDYFRITKKGRDVVGELD